MSTRITPYELLLEPLETVAFPAIRDEAVQRGRDTRRRDQFVLLGNVGATLKEIVPDDAPAAALEEYAELLYHGFQFWTYGRRLYTMDDAVFERLTTPELTIGEWPLAGPPASYIQLPYQRLWGRVSAESPYEPVDGVFVVLDKTEPAPEAGAHLRTQLLLGVRPDRLGISLVSYRTDLNPRLAASRASHPWREEGEPFANAIPGGERKGYRTIATTSELEALVIRVLHHIVRDEASVVPADGSAADGKTKLPHLRIGMRD